MKYAELYPEAVAGEMVENDILVSDTEGCIMCHEPTKFVEVCSEAHICSPECVKDFYNFYDEATERRCQD